jgi:hypothetical protein
MPLTPPRIRRAVPAILYKVSPRPMSRISRAMHLVETGDFTVSSPVVPSFPQPPERLSAQPHVHFSDSPAVVSTGYPSAFPNPFSATRGPTVAQPYVSQRATTMPVPFSGGAAHHNVYSGHTHRSQSLPETQGITPYSAEDRTYRMFNFMG